MLWSRSRRKGLGSAAGAAASVLLLLQVLAGPGVLTTRAHAPARATPTSTVRPYPKSDRFFGVPPPGVPHMLDGSLPGPGRPEAF